MSKITEVCEIALIIKDEADLSLEVSATIAERLYDEGCRMNPITQPVDVPITKKGYWYKDAAGVYRCIGCRVSGDPTHAYCHCCGSRNI